MNNFNLIFSSSSLVLDFGTANTRSGLSTSPTPQFIFYTLIANQKYKTILPLSREKTIISPPAALRSLFNIREPIKRGVFIDPQEDFQKLFSHVVQGLNQKKSQLQKVLICSSSLTPRSQKAQVAKILFEKEGVQKLFFGSQPVFACFGMGRTSGLVVESGHGVTQTAAVIDGKSIKAAENCFHFGGVDVDEYLWYLL